MGKEKRKIKPSAEGKLGVEGIDCKIILDAFDKAGVMSSAAESRVRLTKKQICLSLVFQAVKTVLKKEKSF